MRRRTFRLLVSATLLLLGFAAGNAVAINLTVTAPDFVGAGVYAVDTPLPMPSLRELTAGTTTDSAAYAALVDYYHAHEQRIAQMFNESHSTRLRALYAMYLVHNSAPYGALADVSTFQQFLAAAVADCSDYARWQYELSSALGVDARQIVISGGTHVWTEVNVDGQWEVFDGTVNVWINRAGYELERGAERRYRTFYTPLLETSTPVALSGQRLRIQMMGLGVYWLPKAYLYEL